MPLLDDIFQRGYRDAQNTCNEYLQSEEMPLTEDLVYQIADPSEDGGWGEWLYVDDTGISVLGCEPYSPEWEERLAAYVNGAKRGADDWVALQLIELDAREVETAVRAESPETAVMPREIMADWLEDRDDPRAEKLRIAPNPPPLSRV